MNDIKSIKNIIDDYKNINIDNVVTKSDIYFIKKYSINNERAWISMKMEQNSTLNRLYNTFKYGLDKKIYYRSNGKNYEKKVLPYSPTTTGDSEKIYYTTESYLNSQLNKFKAQLLSKELNKLELKDMQYYTYKVSLDDNSLYLVGRIDKINRINDGFVAKFKGKEIEITKNDKFGISEYFDFIIYNDQIYIFNKNNFENFFDLEEKFKDETRKHVKEISKSNYFIGLEDYLKEIEDNKAYTKRISKALDEFREKNIDYSKIDEEDFKERIGIIAENFEGIKINNEGKVVYNDKEDIESITKLIIDDYFISIISQTFGSSD
ncbi:Kiwa anti-phage protein KwaB-like domain-containing protein [Staphylococcus sp. FSL W8-0304]|nr:Kiwa anti-phage protein KwaB-like domain-containing protein [Staphylococcus epidermidis]KEI48152.1 hypothetical protein L086_0101330 [Staphylococcus epidermidis UC7032]MCG2128270.1 DUF4868 domain-containing protein [Staphylococcus epidermidis]SUM26018.1 Uncharacterised protein [Staphylococcus epidermidis]